MSKIVIDIDGKKTVNYRNLILTDELDNEPFLTFEMMVNEEFDKLIQLHSVVTLNRHRYLIKEYNTAFSGVVPVYCQYDLREIEGLFKVGAYVKVDTLYNIVADLISGSGWKIEGEDDGIKKRIEASNMNHLEIIRQARELFYSEVMFDNVRKVVTVAPEIGEDNKVRFTRDLNLIEPYIKVDSYDYANIIYPIGKDGLTIKDVNNGDPFLRVEAIRGVDKIKVFEDGDIDNARDLLNVAKKELDEISRPLEVYELTINDLSYREGYEMYNINVGDTVYLLDFKKKHRIVKKIMDVNRPYDVEVILANKPVSVNK